MNRYSKKLKYCILYCVHFFQDLRINYDYYYFNSLRSQTIVLQLQITIMLNRFDFYIVQTQVQYAILLQNSNKYNKYMFANRINMSYIKIYLSVLFSIYLVKTLSCQNFI